MFSKILFLTQAERPERTKQCLDELKRVGLKAEPFYAITAENPFQSFCLSQRGMLERAKEYVGSVLLLEDDVLFKEWSNIDSVMNELPKDFDILYLGANVTCEPEYHSPHLRKVTSAWTSHAILYSQYAIHWILNHYKDWETHGMYDDWLSREFLPNHKCYVAAPMLAIQRPVYSDLWQKNVSYGWDSVDQKLMNCKKPELA
jgi:hypothetical protein